MEPRSSGLVLEMKRVITAPAPLVFAALSEATELAKWWGPDGYTVPSLTFRARVGDSYRIEMQPPEGDVFHITGEFREVSPPSRLAYTFGYEPPDPDDVETVVTLSLQGLGGSTEVSLEHGTFKTEARRALHHDGWTESFDRLDRIIGSG